MFAMNLFLTEMFAQFDKANRSVLVSELVILGLIKLVARFSTDGFCLSEKLCARNEPNLE